MAPSRTRTSKDLLQLEQQSDTFRPGIKSFSICKTKKVPRTPFLSKALPSGVVVAGSDVLHRVQNFLPLLSEANQKLSEAIKTKGPDAYDIEFLDGDETATYVEMELALGVADLHSNDAVSAAEKLIGGQIVNYRQRSEIQADADGENLSSSDDESDNARIPGQGGRRPKIEVLS